MVAKKNGDVAPLVQEIRGLPVPEAAKTASIALLNLIPYVGGAVASVIGETANRRRFEKVCDVLSDLNVRLEESRVDPEEHLSQDQIIELVHETLQTVATASDKEKIEALKNGLGYAFIKDDVFERKQLFLQVLRGCTSLELILIPTVYNSGDPHLLYEGGPAMSSSGGWPEPSAMESAVVIRSQPRGHWEPAGNEEDSGRPTLLAFLADSIHFDEGATEGAARLLDAKGLTDLGPNLNRKDCKVFQWIPYDNMAYVSGSVGTYRIPSTPVPTPLEASQTQFGKDFLRFYVGH
jgi:hypothetical protein